MLERYQRRHRLAVLHHNALADALRGWASCMSEHRSYSPRYDPNATWDMRNPGPFWKGGILRRKTASMVAWHFINRDRLAQPPRHIMRADLTATGRGYSYDDDTFEVEWRAEDKGYTGSPL